MKQQKDLEIPGLTGLYILFQVVIAVFLFLGYYGQHSIHITWQYMVPRLFLDFNSMDGKYL